MTANLQTGITTGACAAAAAKAAAMVLRGMPAPPRVEITLPQGAALTVGVLYARKIEGGAKATASVRKDAGDDPDVTHGLEIVVTVWPAAGPENVFLAGSGVGTVTKPGLQIPPGQPAINPGPRRMIAAAIADVSGDAMCVEVSIPRGREVAAETFNPRLGIVGGLSVLGTTGIVRPYCRKALLDALTCSLNVAEARGVKSLVLVPGNIGLFATRGILSLSDDQMIEVGNEWGFIVDALAGRAFEAVLLAGHPGKLAKLAARDWDTHSARSASALGFVAALIAETQGCPLAQSATTEGLFEAMSPADRRRTGCELARRIRAAVSARIDNRVPVAVLLVNMAGEELGRDGEFTPWE